MKIIVVDDMRVNLETVTIALKPEGYEIKTFQSSLECANALKDVTTDLFLLDMEMPELTGLELAAKIRAIQKFSRVPILFFTSSVDPEHLEKAFEIGAVDFLPKHLSHLEIRLRVRNALKLAQANDKLQHQAKMLEIYLRLIFHDLASPLTICDHNLRRLKTLDLEAQGPVLEKVSKSLGRISDLIADTKSFFQGAVPTKFCSPIQLTTDMQFIYEQRLLEKSIKIEERNSAGEATQVKIPRSFMAHQIMANFISNSIKYSDAGSNILIAYLSPKEADGGTYMDIIIRDYGKGMTKEQVEAFAAGHVSMSTTGTTGETGTGSGVMIAKFFLSKFGATIDIKSYTEKTPKNERGTVVKITVPVAVP
jgi:two-component system, sensor histidine kinase and response regulator